MSILEQLVEEMNEIKDSMVDTKWFHSDDIKPDGKKYPIILVIILPKGCNDYDVAFGKMFFSCGESGYLNDRDIILTEDYYWTRVSPPKDTGIKRFYIS